jgi:hypothetical protein
VNRDNISDRPDLKILAEYRGVDSRIFFTFFDLQMVRNIKMGKDKNNGNDYDKENFPPVRRLIFIISLIFCERKRVNIGRINQN